MEPSAFCLVKFLVFRLQGEKEQRKVILKMHFFRQVNCSLLFFCVLFFLGKRRNPFCFSLGCEVSEDLGCVSVVQAGLEVHRCQIITAADGDGEANNSSGEVLDLRRLHFQQLSCTTKQRMTFYSKVSY